MANKFMGFERKNGVGVRNHILIIPTVGCGLGISKVIFNESFKFYNTKDGELKLLNNLYGCGQTGKDLEQTERTLINIGKNPNVNSVLVVALGCESLNYEKVADEISKEKNTFLITIQELGGKKTIERAVGKIKEISKDAKKEKRKSFGVENLTIGLMSGGSDFTSGLVSNPILGRVSDFIVNSGGTTIMSEIPEFIGVEHLYASRAINSNVKQKILNTIKNMEEKLKKEGEVDFRGAQPTPGNIKGGITTLEEKNLGAIKKSGSAPVIDVLDYAERPNKRGHFLMNAPGYDLESVSGKVGAGANIILFTTGRGTPSGNVVAPVIKITANSKTYEIMNDFVDLDFSSVLREEESIDDASKRLFDYLIKVVNGLKTKSELYKSDDFGIYRIGPTY